MVQTQKPQEKIGPPIMMHENMRFGVWLYSTGSQHEYLHQWLITTSRLTWTILFREPHVGGCFNRT